MFRRHWSLWASMKQILVILTICTASLVASTSIHTSSQDSQRSPLDSSLPNGQDPHLVDRAKREASIPEVAKNTEEYESRDKKAPRGFLGMRGKKAPSGFLGLRGRRSDNEDFSEEDLLPYRSYDEVPNALEEEYTPRMGEPLEGSEQVIHPLDLIKRAPSGFLGLRGKKAPSGFLGMRGKKAPSGFLGLRGKKAPSGFLGLRGKKAPSGFLGLRGKKDDAEYDDLESVLQALKHRYRNQDMFQEDKRAPRGFLGMRGKKGSPEYPMDADFAQSLDDGYRPYNEELYYDTEHIYDKRAPSRFLGLRG